MKAIQYPSQITIRGVSQATNVRLRKIAAKKGLSINAVILEMLGTRPARQTSAADALGDFFGAGPLGDDVQRILDQDDKEQKALVAREWANLRDN